MYNTISEIKEANRARGHYFFRPEAMRFFRSRIAPGVIGGRFFVTSEQFCDRGECQARKYTIRVAQEDGTVDTVGDFGAYDTLGQARRAARERAARDAAMVAAMVDAEDAGAEELAAARDSMIIWMVR